MSKDVAKEILDKINERASTVQAKVAERNLHLRLAGWQAIGAAACGEVMHLSDGGPTGAAAALGFLVAGFAGILNSGEAVIAHSQAVLERREISGLTQIQNETV